MRLMSTKNLTLNACRRPLKCAMDGAKGPKEQAGATSGCFACSVLFSVLDGANPGGDGYHRSPSRHRLAAKGAQPAFSGGGLRESSRKDIPLFWRISHGDERRAN